MPRSGWLRAHVRILVAVGSLAVSGAAGAVVDEAEPNDSTLTAQDVSGGAADLADGYLPSGAGVLVRGAIAPGDVDYVSFGLRAGQLVTVSVYQDAEGAFDDPAIALFDPTAVQVAADDDSGQGFLPSFAHAVTQDGVYRAAIGGFRDTAFDGSAHDETFDYELAISVTTAPASFGELDSVANDAPAGAEPVPPGSGPFETRAPGGVAVISGSLAPGDVDHYQVPVNGAGRIDVALFDTSGDPFSDPVVRLLDDTLAVVETDDDTGPGFLSSVSAPINGGSSWTIAVEGFQPNSSPHPESMSYELVVSLGESGGVRRCDPTGDDVVDLADIGAIFNAFGETSTGPDDLRDDDGDGTISVLDARACVLECDYAECAPPPNAPACGLVGLELLLIVPGIRVLRRLGRRNRGEG